MAERPEFHSYQAFFPYYVAMHAKPATRQVHFAGTMIGLAFAVIGLLTRRPRLVLGLPGAGYGFAWPAHWFIEKNNPASFGHPLWSLRGDVEMIKYMFQGRDAELTAIAQTYLREHDPYGRAMLPAEEPAAA